MLRCTRNCGEGVRSAVSTPESVIADRPGPGLAAVSAPVSGLAGENRGSGNPPAEISQPAAATQPAETQPCIHCGLPTLCDVGTPPERVFCCAGCLGAYQLIHGWGLEDFYALRDQMNLTGAAQAAAKANRYDQFDQPEFLGPSTPVQLGDGTCRTEFAIHGLHCGACAWLIENAAAREPGLLSARVKMSDHTIRFIFDPAITQLSHIARLLDRLGYGLAPIDPNRDDQFQRENRRLLAQIAYAGFFAANAMWIAIALYAGEYSGVEDQYRYFLGLVGTALGAAAVVGPGRTFFVGALASLRTRTPHMDLPLALALSVGTVVGTSNAILGHGHIYFDSLAALVFLLLIGRWIQFRQQQRAARSVDLMLRITPRHATLVSGEDDAGESHRTVLVDTLRPGDVIHVAAGEHVPADGQVVRGQSNMDRSLLTGESLPVPVHMGESVAAGTINLTAPVDVQVTATGRDSRIGRVMQSVEAAATEKIPIVQLADRLGGIFVVTVTCLALATFAFWSQWSLAEATANATALLIVACPCALALATPLAIAVGLGRAAKSNILIRDGQALQQLAKPGVLWFDKTGTLTEGKQRVTTLHGSQDGLRLAASIEASCRHPVAQSIVFEAERRRLTLPSGAILDRVSSGGVLGTVDQSQVCVGNLQHMQQQRIGLTDDWRHRFDQLAAAGESPILIAVDGQVLTLLGLSDPLRPDAQQMVEELKQRGWTLGMLSGDHPGIVLRVADALGLPRQRCFGAMSPEDKLATIRQSRQAGRSVVMIGDGANDAAALAAADVGIALRGGAEVSLQAAPVFIASGRLASLLTLLRGATSTTRLLILTFSLSLAYNLVAVGLAMSGWVSPLAAAILMPLSSVSVLGLTLAWRSFGEKPH